MSSIKCPSLYIMKFPSVYRYNYCMRTYYRTSVHKSVKHLQFLSLYVNVLNFCSVLSKISSLPYARIPAKSNNKHSPSPYFNPTFRCRITNIINFTLNVTVLTFIWVKSINKTTRQFLVSSQGILFCGLTEFSYHYSNISSFYIFNNKGLVES